MKRRKRKLDNLVVVISGPSGSGKSTVIQEILSKKKKYGSNFNIYNKRTESGRDRWKTV